MSDERPKVPSWLVERLAAGDYDAKTASSVRARLQAAEETARLGDIDASNREILAAYPSATVAAEIERRLRGVTRAVPARSRDRWWLMVPSLAAIACAGLVAVMLTRDDVERAAQHESAVVEPARPEVVTPKGMAPHIIVYKKTASKPVRLSSGTVARAGDVLQLTYVSSRRRYGVVASVDGTGTTTLHLPRVPGPAAALVEIGETALPQAFELDASPGFERFVFVTSDEPFSTAGVEAALARGRPLPSSLRVMDVVIRKQESP